MTDRPILFSAPMTRALLDGRKTQTRRALKPQPQPDMGLIGIYGPRLTAVFGYGTPDADCKVPIKYIPGDRLWVREAWHAARSLDRTAPRDIPHDADIEYAATARSYAEIGLKGKLRPSMFMPRRMSRLTLYVSDVRVQRLQDISEADAIAEGIEKDHAAGMPSVWGWRDYLRGNDIAKRHFADPYESYRTLWNSINGPGAWDDNPWVAAYTFEVWQGNIDGLPAEIGEAA